MGRLAQPGPLGGPRPVVGLFRRSPVEAVARRTPRLTPTGQFGSSAGATGWGTGGRQLVTADFPVPPVAGVFDRLTLMTIPAVARARNIICSAVGSLPVTLWTYRWDQDAPIENRTPPASWMARPDPNHTRQWMLAWTTDDLLFHARAYWRITSRLATGYPATFERLAPLELNVDTAGAVTYHGQAVDPADIVEFVSFTEALVATGWRTFSTTLKLEEAADRFSGTEIPAGWLKQTGGEPLTAEELGQWADAFAARRRANVTAALGIDFDYHEASADPERMQLVEARDHQAAEAARLIGLPPWAVGAPSNNSMTYQNAETARRDVVDFGALPFIQCIEQTLSGPNVTPYGQAVRLDLDAWLRSPFTEGEPSANDLERAFDPEPDPAPVPAPEEATP